MQRLCFTLDLRPDQTLVDEYVEHHREGRPEIHQSIRDAGVLDMQIFLLGTRLFMIMDATDTFNLQAKAEMDRENPAVLAWEELMARYQAVDPASDATDRWQRMTKIFQLDSASADAPCRDCTGRSTPELSSEVGRDYV